MEKVTHRLTMNGRVDGEAKDLVSPSEVVGRRLGLLDGVVRYSLSLWRPPVGVPFDRVDLVDWPQQYVQAAGSADGMTVEVRRLGEPGRRQYVVGRAGLETSGPPVEIVIPWNGCETGVYSSEVFSAAEAAEAAEVFAGYYDTGQVPGTCRLWPLPL